MSDDIRNNRFNLSDEEFTASLPKVKPNYSRTKNQVWEEIEQRIGKGDQRPSLRRHSWWRYSVAAAVAMLIGVVGFMRFYTMDYSTVSQDMMAVILPDGSQVQLNGASSVSFHPHWWRFQRQVSLTGEAFFEVERGKRFKVVSQQGVTAVLGTSFNVYARAKNYEVVCHTGKVRVSDPKELVSIDITSKQKASIAADGTLVKEENIDLKQSSSWTEAMFKFAATPIAEVFLAIERQYQVRINYSSDLELSYSGQFSREIGPDQVMNIVCRSFALNCVKKGNTYTVSKTNE